MQKQFLISFCNNKTNIDKQNNGFIGLLSVDMKSQSLSFQNITLQLPNDLIGNGVTGMCYHQGRLVLLLQRMPSTLLFLNDSFELVDYWPLADIKGVHSILSKGDSIYLSVTNQDKIVKVNNDKSIQVMWSKGTQSDSIHLNSICLHNNKIYATAFGAKKNKLWMSARSGTAFCIDTDETVIDGIWHPHSLFSYQNQLYCCDSSNQRVIGREQSLLSDLPGYSRGLYINDELIICGNSLGRQVSHSTGIKISNKSDKGILAGVCGISAYFKHSGEFQFLDLTNSATEIFEVLPLETFAI